MAGPQDHNYQYQAYQAPSQPYHDLPEVSPVEGARSPPFPQQPGQAMGPPPPPLHRSPVATQPDTAYAQMQNQRPYGSQNYSNFSPPVITPGADNLGETAAGGGINGIARDVADANERESGAQAIRDVNNWGRNGDGAAAGLRGAPLGPDPSGTPFADHYGYDTPPRALHPHPSYGHNVPIAAAGALPPSIMSSSNSDRSIPLENRPSPADSISMYQDNPYNRYSSSNLGLAPQLGAINPNDADDDDDWGMGPRPAATQAKRRSFVPFSASRDVSRGGTPTSAAAAAAGVAAASDANGIYNAVPGGSGAAASAPALLNEKSEWLASQKQGGKRLKWIVGSVIVLVIIGAIVGGVLGAVLKDNDDDGDKKGGDNAQQTAEEDDRVGLTVEASEIQELLSNKALHKVFPGMDYTPLNSQYPDCMHNPPSQNNITRDMAVLSQLTSAVRLYGTDCNQTEMVLTAIERLDLKDMKVWLGVWLGNNQTTNDRQLKQMWNILDDYKDDVKAGRFKGIILGNEVLYREDLTETELFEYITDVKKELEEKEIDLHIATSDLGDNWKEHLAVKVDIVMSNVHPFFAGVTAEAATGWTWSFWQNTDVILTQDDPSIKQIIAEVGWPSAGGNHCGANECTNDTEGSVASIENMNTFMEDWVCPSMANGTEYFWFSAFDEPWKIRFNEKGKEWEDKWGLMDVNRKLKKGVVIPDCGGKTAS